MKLRILLAGVLALPALALAQGAAKDAVAKVNGVTVPRARLDFMMQKEYDRVKAQNGDKEYRARHILVDTEDQAKGLIADLKKGAKFDELATKNSKDQGSKTRGGDLDWNVPTVFDKAFADALSKLEK